LKPAGSCAPTKRFVLAAAAVTPAPDEQREPRPAVGRRLLSFGSDTLASEYLDQEQALRLKPDITWWKRGRVRAIVDAKYKRLVDVRFPNADAYQMLADCTAFGLPQGLLVYARDAEQRSRLHHIEAAGTEIKVRAVNVERQPENVLGQVDELAAEIALVLSSE
jgi:hypothetical protein